MHEDLLALERKGTEALTTGRGAAFYAEVLTDDALMVVPGYVVDKAMFLASVGSESAWSSFAIEEARVVQLTPVCAIVLYRGRGIRPGQEEYVARISSTYVKCGEAWKLAYHQQTPDPRP
jgi:hypothetical protein